MRIKRILTIILSFSVFISSISGVAFANNSETAVKASAVFNAEETSIADFEVTDGYVLDNDKGITYSAVGQYKVISKTQTTGSDFYLQVKLAKLFNQLLIFFNYTDASNYSYIKIGGEAELFNVSDGTETLVYSAAVTENLYDLYSDIRLYRENGYLTFTINGNEIYRAEDEVEDTVCIDGRYGAGFMWTYGYIREINLMELPEEVPTEEPTAQPTDAPTEEPADTPTEEPIMTDAPDEEATAAPYDGSVKQYNLNSADEFKLLRDTVPYTFSGDKFNVNDVSRIAIITKDNYSAPAKLSVGIWHSFNRYETYFAYKDDNNYCYINHGAEVKIAKVVNGTETVVAVYPKPLDSSNWKDLENVITLRKGGIIDFDVIYEGVTYNVASNLQDDAFAVVGGFGGGFDSTPGYISSVKATRYMTVSASNTTDGFGIADNAELEFNFEPTAESVTADTIKVCDSKGNKIGFAAELDGNKVTLDFDGVLDYKTEYTLTVDGVKSETVGMLEAESYTFKTAASPFDLSAVYAKSDGVTVYNEDMSSLNGAVENSITADTELELYIKAENMRAACNATVIVALEDTDGKVYDIKQINAVFGENAQGYITEEGTVSQTEKRFVVLNAPDIENKTFRISYFIADTAGNMNSLYPYTGTDTVQSGDEKVTAVIGDGKVITISGISDTAAAGGYVNITLSDAESIYKAAAVKSDANGAYKLSFVVNEELLPSSGTYKVKSFGSEMNGIKEAEVYLSKSDDITDAIKELNSASNKNDMLSKINNYEDTLSFKSYRFDGTANPYNVINKGELAEMMYEYVKTKSFTANDINSFVLTASAVCAYNQSLTDYLYGDDNAFVYLPIINFADAVEGDNGAYSVYLNGLTDAGRAKVRAGILNNGCKDRDELFEVFVQQVIVASVKNYKDSGYGHLEDILLANGEAAGLDISDYEDLSSKAKTNKAIYNANISSIDDIEDILDKIGSEGGGSSSSGSGGGGGGSSYGGVTPSVVDGAWQKFNSSAPVSEFVEEAAWVGIQKGFTDLAGYDWAKEAIEYLYDKGVVNGKADGIFAPGDMIKREEFVKMLVTALDIQGGESTYNFSDVDANEWYVPYINVAYSSGVVNGISDTEFGIGMSITRQDAATMIYRALSAAENTSDTAVLDSYSDKSEIADYAFDAFAYMVSNGCITGMTDTTLAPRENSNRAQIAVILYRVINMGGTK